MKQRSKNFLQSPYMFLIFMAIKVITYYVLIDVNIIKNMLVMGSLFVLAIIFLSYCISDVKRKKLWFMVTYIFISLFMYIDCMYYSYYHQTVSLNQIWQVSQLGKVPNSLIATIVPSSFIILIEIPFTYHYFKKNIDKWQEKKQYKKKIKLINWCSLALILLIVANPIHSTQMIKVNSVGFFTNHISDICRIFTDKVSAKEVPAQEVIATVEETVHEENGFKYQNIGKGRNLIVIQMESFQNFLIGAYYNGQVLTPNLNKLLEKDTIYFDNFYSNIGKGNTADAEISSMNSLYPIIECDSYSLYLKNTFNGLPWLLSDHGYNTFAVHGNDETFYQRNEAYVYQGFQDYISKEDMDASDIIGMGVSDKSMFKQTIETLKTQTTPYFAFINTLTNHHPYDFPEEMCDLLIKEEDKDTQFANYLQTAHYADAAIGQFIDDLKAQGLYENTVIALYGDHHGLNCTWDSNNEKMSAFLGRNYDFDEMFNVPLIINVPGIGTNETISTVGGQIDFLPTMENIMGIEKEQPYILGQDIVNAKEGFVAFTAYLLEGSFVKDGVMFEVSREGLFEGSRAWEIGTENELNIEDYKDDYERALKAKKASREIMDQDLIADYITR